LDFLLDHSRARWGWRRRLAILTSLFARARNLRRELLRVSGANLNLCWRDYDWRDGVIRLQPATARHQQRSEQQCNKT
jgi:hypothetical protein